MKKIIAAFLISAFGVLALVSAPSATTRAVSLDDVKKNTAKGQCEVSGGTGCSTSSTTEGNFQSILSTIVNILLFLVGSIAVIMLVIGGLRYVTSNGDSGQISQAKNTILYAIIGIVVAVLAYAAVNFVITELKPPTTPANRGSSTGP